MLVRMERAWMRVLADRRGAMTVEYAMIVAGATTIVVACYRKFFERAAEMVGYVTFTG